MKNRCSHIDKPIEKDWTDMPTVDFPEIEYRKTRQKIVIARTKDKCTIYITKAIKDAWNELDNQQGFREWIQK